MFAAVARAVRILRRLDAIRRKAPHVEIAQYGWRTASPKITVSVVSRGGMSGLFTFADDVAGNAGATLAAANLANVIGLTVVDRRPSATNEASSDTLTAGWKPLPRAADLAAA